MGLDLGDLSFGLLSSEVADLGEDLKYVAFGVVGGQVYDYVMEGMIDDAQFNTMSGRTATGRDPTASRKIVYGECRTGGTIVYLANSGVSNIYLHQMTCFAVGECESIEEIWYDDKMVMKLDAGTPKYYDEWSSGTSPSTTPKYTYIKTKTGADNQVAVTGSSETGKELPSQWSSNHRLFDICYAYTRFDLEEGNPYDGQPNVTARIKGRKLYDPRKDSTSSMSGTGSHRPDDPATWEYSNNSALCVLDYLTNSSYGANISHDDINYTALEIALDICDEDVTTQEGTQKRYTCDGVINTESSLRNNVASILSSMNGKITFSGGQFFIDAYAYKTPHSVVVDESMMLGSFTVRTKQSKRDSYNQVRGTFMSAEDNFQPSEFPTKTFSQYVTDDGEVLEHEMQLSMTTDVEAAQRLARLTLLRSRMQDTLKMQLNMKGLQYRVGDNIKVSNAKFGIVEKEFEITRLGIVPDVKNGIVVDIEGKEVQLSIFDWQSSYADAYDSGNTIQLYDPNVVAPLTGMFVIPIAHKGNLNDTGSIVPEVGFRVTWDAINDTTLRYKVEATLNGRTTIAKTIDAFTNFVEFVNLEQNQDYEITIFVMRHGVESTGYTETHRSGRATDYGGGTYTYTTTQSVAAMTETEFLQKFGKMAQAGDQLTVLQIDPYTLEILDSRSYVYEAEIYFSQIVQTVGGRPANFPRRSQNIAPVYEAIISVPVAFEDVTWSAALSANTFGCTDTSITTFTDMSIVEVLDNDGAGSTAKLIVTAPLANIDARDTRAMGYEHPTYAELGTVNVTATFDNQTVENTFFNIYIAVEMDT